MLLFFSGSFPSGACGYSTLKITDGTTTADLTDQTNYQLVDGGWAPSVAPLRKSTLGGSGPYEDVIEEIVVNVHGTTAATCLANLAKLSQLLDQAERWSRGEPVSAVKIQCLPWGSSISTECVILGRVNDKLLSLPATFNDKLEIGIYEVPYVRLRFVRRGLWLASEETVGPGAYAKVVAKQTATFASAAAISSPVAIRLEQKSGAALLTDIYLLITDDAAKIGFIEAEDFTPSGVTWSEVTDTTYNARGDKVLRLTASDTALQYAFYPTSGFISTDCRRLAIFAAVRNNYAATTFQMYAKVNQSSLHGLATPAITVDYSDDNPRIFFLGIVTAQEAITDIYLYLQALTTPGAGSIDIDYVAMIGLDDDASRVITLAIDGQQSGDIFVNPRALTSPSPVAHSGVPVLPRYVPYYGDAWVNTAAPSWLLVFWQPVGRSAQLSANIGC